jgi:acyl phosphate:glycerol-3-phosphate acyltransferase
MLPIIISSLIGYICGSFQSAYILGKTINKIDIRDHGTANAGASNVTMVMGIKFGFFTFILDLLKVIIAMNIVSFIFQITSHLQIYSGLFAVLGHIFPFYLNFKGGKGVTTLIGMFFVISFNFGSALFLLLMLFSFAFNYIGLTGIFLYVISPFCINIFTSDPLILTTASLVSLIGIFKHRENVCKIRKNEEKKVREFFKEKFIEGN